MSDQLNVGDLLVSLGIDPSAFGEGLKKSIEDARKFRKELDEQLGEGLGKTLEASMRDIGPRVVDGLKQGMISGMDALAAPVGAKLAAAVGAAALAGVAALGLATNSMLQLADRMSNLADRTGVGTEALQKFQFAGAAVGVTAEQIAGSMQKFQRSLVSGNEATTAAIGKLGLTRQALANMLPEDQLTTILTALNDKIPNAANRTQIAMALLGRAGASLVPLGADLKAAMQQAEDLGLVMSKGDIAAADALGDSIGKLGMTFGGLINNIGATITSNESLFVAVEAVTKILGNLSKGVKDNRSTMQQFVSGGVELVVSGLQLMVQGVELAINAVDGLRLAWLSALNVGGMLAKVQLEMRLAAAEKGDARQHLLNSVGMGGDVIDQADASVKNKANIEDLKNQIKMVEGWQLELSDKANGVVAGNAKWTESTQKVSAALAALQVKLAGVAGQQVKVTNTGKATAAQLDANAKAAKDAADAAKKSDETQKNMMDAMEASQEKVTKWFESIVGAGTEDITNQVALIAQELARVGGAAALSEVQADKLAKKLKELRTINEAGFNAGASTEMKQLASLVTPGGKGISREGLDGVTVGSGSRALGSKSLHTTEEDARAAHEFREALNRASGSLERLGESMGGFAGGLAKMAGGIAGAFTSGNLGSALSKNGGTTGDKVSAGAGAASDLVGIWKDNRQNMSGAGGAMSGAASGAKAGAAFGPYGVAIGAVVGAAAGFFSGQGFRKMAKDAGKVLGVEMTSELAKAIDNTKKSLKVSTEAASLLNISTAMKDKDPRQFGAEVVSLMAGIKAGTIPAKEGLEELSRSFGAIADSAMKAGSVGDKALVGILKGARQAGMETPEMKAFVQDQLAAAAAGTGGMTGIKIVSEADAKAQAVIFSTTFWASVKEMGIIGASEAFKDSFAKLGESLKASGFDVSAIMAPIEQIMNLSSNDMFRGAAEGAAALNQSLMGVANAGYLTTDSFAAFQQQATAAFNQAVAGGASSAQALQTIAPFLQSLASAAQNYNIPLDAATQALMEQAKQAGVAFKTDPLEKMAAATDRMVVALEKLAGITPRVAAGFNQIGAAASSFGSGPGQGPSLPGDIPEYGRGGRVERRTLAWIGESGPETVIPDSALMTPDEVRESLGGDWRGDFDRGGVSGSAADRANITTVTVGDVVVQIPPGVALDPGQVAQAVLAALRDNTAGLSDRVETK